MMSPQVTTTFIPDPNSESSYIEVEDIEIEQSQYRVAQGPPFTAGPCIEFNGEELRGVSLKDAFSSSFRKGDLQSTKMADGRTESAISSNTNKIIIRILWQGCQPFEFSIGVEEMAQGVPKRINKANLAHKVAKTVRRFYYGPNGYKKDATWDQFPGRTPNQVPFEQLVLVRLDHVSQGSYQPVLVQRTTKTIEFLDMNHSWAAVS
ncbi:hypothetical protein BDY19DRAFT_1058349 [Irpex rosettiformis]|uniref:Uncharacterized protein n=1 Tax=Irpex rosettiformis TaxID=378272 RepID=A0ACB8TYT1_9APHY|nr:hypothetical protein BDY19DRAFT_1058349 [Irpex rosettiformis]